MKIVDVKVGNLATPLIKPFKTALRTLYTIENIIVIIETDEGLVGYGGAAPTAVITGDTRGSILGGIDHIKTHILGKDIRKMEDILITLNKCMVGNTSAKAAVDMAIYDLYGKLHGAPLYQLLGGYRREMRTDITISLNDPEEMARDSVQAVKEGYKTLKVKVGKDANMDIERMLAIRQAVGAGITLRVDANQGWHPKEAVRAIKRMELSDIGIDLAEQPVLAKNLEGMKYVTDRVAVPVLADESVFSPRDALKIIEMRAADMMNIKLMKTGGIYNALKIIALAESAGMHCMIGSMMESRIGVTAAAHLGMGKSNIVDVDLDVPLLCKEDPVSGGVSYHIDQITLSEKSGLGLDPMALGELIE